MTKELTRLSEDESALIQAYRHLSEDARTAILLATMQMRQAQSAPDNVIALNAKRRA